MASALAGDTCWLARRASCEQPDAAVLCCIKCFDVMVNRDVPDAFESFSEPLLFFAHCDGSNTIRSGCDGEQSEATEDVETGSFIHGKIFWLFHTPSFFHTKYTSICG